MMIANDNPFSIDPAGLTGLAERPPLTLTTAAQHAFLAQHPQRTPVQARHAVARTIAGAVAATGRVVPISA